MKNSYLIEKKAIEKKGEQTKKENHKGVLNNSILGMNQQVSSFFTCLSIIHLRPSNIYHHIFLLFCYIVWTCVHIVSIYCVKDEINRFNNQL